ncbi:hypothetical protein DAEQUDRAFT_410989 [Daedalea quercina L-15889]|uniref:RING-type domain-containing protein n=1 Tax=Daedalea quercina L-15889 TaxID=1314783 RepID=A0A165NL38_9APHY|nr:hypothetical protein DAEQUDRAFT_410989 [Daedalea quercina L-15889]
MVPESAPAEPENHVSDDATPANTDSSPVSTAPTPDSPPEVEAPPQAPRQFPPPGTLVVVQGVVNTTDVPSSDNAASSSRRPSRSTTPRPSSTAAGQRSDIASLPIGRDGERHGGRNRLSSFINRSRPPTDSRATELMSSNRDSAVSSDMTSSVTSHDIISGEESSIVDDQDSDHDDGDAHPRPLSQGSIDVLGTLLSVAAAATAASLFSPGFAFPGTNSVGGSSPDAARPMSPTPTAGLGNLAGLGSLAGLGIDPSGASAAPGQGAAQPRDGRDRIRNVWESVRDRLGLHRGQSDGGGSTEGDSTSEVRMRPGDMFTEMARALNIGLGLGDGNVPSTRQTDGNAEGESSSTGDGTDAANGATSERAERPPPPEDSFERFLLNLQADLRTALSEDGAGHRDSRRERNSVASTAPSTSAFSEDHQPVAGPSSPRRSTDSAPMADATTQTSGSPAAEDDMPPLQDVSDSDSDSDDDGSDEEDEEATHDDHAEHSEVPRSPRTPTPIPTGAFPFGPDARLMGDGERRPPGVNLWRLYRFAPIPASHTTGHAAGTSTAPTNPSDAQAAPLPEAPTTADEPDTASATDTAPDSSENMESNAVRATTPTTDPNANVVVPVIVVGLQSVDMNRANDNAHTPGQVDASQTQDDARSSESESRSSSEWRDSPTPGAGAGDRQSRGRSWQSRAASALRGLRPGRRSSRNRQNRDSAGARTFLIYVIGGYYPPNHHMVTGSDSLDSYEALWELAELLGQVKPPVATREDIDNSGLQIIKSSELSRYEGEGRVASNCVERCLICLEDYEPDEDLRLMTCKHAYHKDCVDKWLQVGRNNCPACRTKGVSTAGDSSSS